MARHEDNVTMIARINLYLGTKVIATDHYSFTEAADQDLEEAIEYARNWKKPSVAECLKKLGQ